MVTTKTNNGQRIVKAIALALMAFSPVASHAQGAEDAKGVHSVYTNSFKDNWEFSLGVEYLAFYSSFEKSAPFFNFYDFIH